MGKRKRILGQDKDISGKLSKQTVKNTVGKFKEQYADRHENPNQPIAGFELNGGSGMMKGGQEEWEKFCSWCDENQLIAIYNSNDDLLKMRLNLRNRVDNKCKNKS